MILKEIEDKYLIDIGYHIVTDKICIYYKDIQINGLQSIYEKVTFEEGLINPKWETIDSNWFEEIWASINEDLSIIQEPVFIEKISLIQLT